MTYDGNVYCATMDRSRILIHSIVYVVVVVVVKDCGGEFDVVSMDVAVGVVAVVVTVMMAKR